MNNKIVPGYLTNKGYVQWVDRYSVLIPDPLVKTDKGLFRLSEVEVITKEQYLIRGTWFDILWFGRSIVEEVRVVPIKK